MLGITIDIYEKKLYILSMCKLVYLFLPQSQKKKKKIV